MLGDRARNRAAIVAVGFAMLLSACGGGDDGPAADPTSTATEAAGHTTGSDAAAELPHRAAQPPSAAATGGSSPADTASTSGLPETVETHRPALLVRPAGQDPTTAHAARAVDGVADLAATSEFTARFVVRPPSDEDDTSPPPTPPAPQQIEVKALGVNPLDFRPLTPDVTAQEPGVWQRLLEGDVVVRHDVAQKLGLELGETYRLLGPDGEIDARIGAFASNGAPPLAEVLVPWTLSAQLGAGEPNLLVVGADDDADPSALGDAIVAAIGGGEVSVRDAPEEQRAQLVGTGRFDFQPFDYTDLGDGMIVIDPAWVQRWITTISLPGIGTTRCHRVMVPQLLKALEEIRAAGLYGHFKPEQFGGCYMPRHIDWDPTKPLSMHAWGLAIDFNTHDNWLGHTPTMDPRIVEIFERWGFEWGGRWARPDGMHFELDRVIEVDG